MRGAAFVHNRASQASSSAARGRATPGPRPLGNFAVQRLFREGEVLGRSPSSKSGLGALALRHAQGDDDRALPHGETVAAHFGRPVDHLRAHVGPAAREACAALGAEAFAAGDEVAFDSSSPTVSTVIHEVAHALQQRRVDRSALASTSLPIADRDGAAETQARSAEARGGSLSAAPAAVAMKPKQDDLASANQDVHLLPALGAPTKLAVLRPGTRVRVVEVLAGGLAYRVEVPSLKLTGIVPAHTITEVSPAEQPSTAPEEPDVSPIERYERARDALLDPIACDPSALERFQALEERVFETQGESLTEDEQRRREYEKLTEQYLELAQTDPAAAKKLAPRIDELDSGFAKEMDEQRSEATKPSFKALLKKAGVEESFDDLKLDWGNGLSPEDGKRLLAYLDKHPPRASQVGPRQVLRELAAAAAAQDKNTSFATLYDQKVMFDHLLVWSPNRYFVRADTGDSIAGSYESGKYPSPYVPGEYYYNDNGTVYRTDEHLQKTGSSIGELHDKGAITATLDGAQDAIVDTALGIKGAVLHPDKALAGAVKFVNEAPERALFWTLNAPANIDEWMTLPSDVQIQQVAHVGTDVVLIVATSGVAGTGTKIVGSAGKLAEIAGAGKWVLVGTDGVVLASNIGVGGMQIATGLGAGSDLLQSESRGGSGGQPRSRAEQAKKKPAEPAPKQADPVADKSSGPANTPAPKKGSLPDWLKKRFLEGEEFNKANRARYAYNEVEVVAEDGQIYRVDSYDPAKGDIVSRRLTQLADVEESTAKGYFNEFTRKYKPGTTITDSTFNPRVLQGQPLKGNMVFEVPVQVKPVPDGILKAAADKGIVIRDVAGKVYQ